MDDIRFEERYDDDYYRETILYFIAPKEMLDNFFPKGKYPDAVSMEIAVEVPINNIEARDATVSVCPTRKTEDGYEDYDWTDIDISYEEIERLFAIADV